MESAEEHFSQEIARLFPKGAALKARIKQILPKPTQ
jgi:sulfur relay (sulfurtransferase) DsrC/TusE family protein